MNHIFLIDKTIIALYNNIKKHYNIHRNAAKISAFSPGKIHNHDCLTNEKILPLNQSISIEQSRFTYSPPGKEV